MLLLESTSSAASNFVNLLATASPLPIFQPGNLPNLTDPLDINSTFLLWEALLQYIILGFKQAASPNAQQYYIPANISSISIEYDGIVPII
jgi:hypothetical protein